MTSNAPPRDDVATIDRTLTLLADGLKASDDPSDWGLDHERALAQARSALQRISPDMRIIMRTDGGGHELHCLFNDVDDQILLRQLGRTWIDTACRWAAATLESRQFVQLLRSRVEDIDEQVSIEIVQRHQSEGTLASWTSGVHAQLQRLMHDMEHDHAG